MDAGLGQFLARTQEPPPDLFVSMPDVTPYLSGVGLMAGGALLLATGVGEALAAAEGISLLSSSVATELYTGYKVASLINTGLLLETAGSVQALTGANVHDAVESGLRAALPVESAFGFALDRALPGGESDLNTVNTMKEVFSLFSGKELEQLEAIGHLGSELIQWIDAPPDEKLKNLDETPSATAPTDYAPDDDDDD